MKTVSESLLRAVWFWALVVYVPVTVHIKRDVGGADGHWDFVPLVVCEGVGEDLCVCLLSFGLEMETHFTLLSTALQLQIPADITRRQQQAKIQHVRNFITYNKNRCTNIYWNIGLECALARTWWCNKYQDAGNTIYILYTVSKEIYCIFYQILGK